MDYKFEIKCNCEYINLVNIAQAKEVNEYGYLYSCNKCGKDIGQAIEDRLNAEENHPSYD